MVMQSMVMPSTHLKKYFPLVLWLLAGGILGTFIPFIVPSIIPDFFINAVYSTSQFVKDSLFPNAEPDDVFVVATIVLLLFCALFGAGCELMAGLLTKVLKRFKSSSR
jgi:hypothetical protein